MSRNLTQRYLRETEIALARAVSISDVTRIAHVANHERMTRANGADVARTWATFADDERTEVTFTPSDRAWFRRPLRALALIAALAIGGSTAHADTARTESAEVTTAKREVSTARAHLKTAREHAKVEHKLASKARKVARAKAALAKAEAGVP